MDYTQAIKDAEKGGYMGFANALKVAEEMETPEAQLEAIRKVYGAELKRKLAASVRVGGFTVKEWESLNLTDKQWEAVDKHIKRYAD